jgi:hypothetical protein
MRVAVSCKRLRIDKDQLCCARATGLLVQHGRRVKSVKWPENRPACKPEGEARSLRRTMSDPKGVA